MTVSRTNFEPLQKGLRGDLITPSDAGYDEARAVYNGMIDRHPAAIARCADEADIQTCIQFARTEGLPVSVRGGGHNAGGLGVADDALVIDLSPMNSVQVDAAAKTVTVGGGTTWREVDAAAGEFGLSVPCGIIGSTGVGGLSLGGGIGYLARQAGLTIDNLISADLVLADGSQVTASTSENPDLFWAIRGGGGNFGVVSTFRFRAQEVPSVFAGPVLYPISATGDVLRWYRETQPSLPRNINGWFGVLTIPPAPPFPEELWGVKACGIVWATTLQGKAAEDAMAPLRSFGEPLIDGLMEMPMSALNTAFDELYPAGLQWYWRADFVGEISDDAIRVHEKYAELLPTGHSTMHLYPIDGAVHDVAESDTAFAYRSAGWAAVIVGVDPEPESVPALRDWTIAYQEELHPTALQGAYINFLMDEGQGRVRASYGGNFDRLQAVKQKYDPTNFFHSNQNIPPAG
ncbi:MAG TPA: FAD-binding oxidoreductase [Actinomycetes bacterium]|nr:FAD-binding oxidoreductase [Actinomycetes bacterium]